MLFQFLVGSVVVVNIGSVLAAVQFKGTNIAGYDMLAFENIDLANHV